MKHQFDKIISEQENIQHVYAPFFFRRNIPAGEQAFQQLIQEGKPAFIHDEIEGQLRELMKSRCPDRKLKDPDYEQLIAGHLKNIPVDQYGVWIYYPWSRRLVHTLDEAEFVEVRTNRNQYKITREERDILATKKIGIMGLSVGQSIALTLTMERGFGELVLADFDLLELSNLNRIRSGVHNLGVYKVVLAAREIAEIDPFLKVTCYPDGITDANIDDFFTANGKLDLLIEECDGLDMKILARAKARELKIPVLMDTSDRGMLDVERFDLEPQRSIMHGLIDNVNPAEIKTLSNEDKVPIILQMLGVDSVSVRAKASMIEVEQSINTWPQLASSVTLGGALVTDVSRRILLGQFKDSGRYYVDLDELVSDKNPGLPVEDTTIVRAAPFAPMQLEEMEALARKYQLREEGILTPDAEMIKAMVAAACQAPSTGNDQPWKWLYTDHVLFLYHDEYRSFSFGDFHKIASFITFGGAYENLYIHAVSRYGIEPCYHFLPLEGNERMVAAIYFRPYQGPPKEKQMLSSLEAAIARRHTNRNLGPRVKVEQSILESLTAFAESIPGAKMQWITDDPGMTVLAETIGVCDRVRLLNDEGHYDFVHREMRWTEKDTEQTKDGIFIHTLGLTHSQLAALQVIKSRKVIESVREIGGGRAFEALAKKSVSAASAMCMITLEGYNLKSFFEGGRSMQRFWLAATNLNLAVHPLISPFYLFPRVLHADKEGLTKQDAQELMELRDKFLTVAHTGTDRAEVFLAKIAIAEEPELKALRLPLDEVLFLQH